MAVIHGGPGAAGEMAPVARELASCHGVLEPLQTAVSLQGQVKELKDVLGKEGALPVVLIGFSWGAWLSFIFTARYPAFVKKLILVSSAPFEEQYAQGVHRTRMNRLSMEEKEEVGSVLAVLNDPLVRNKKEAFRRFGELLSKADAYDPIKEGPDKIDYQPYIFYGVWKDAGELRRTGRLLEYGKDIICPVLAIHGSYDPHPALGVEKPLAQVLRSFKFILLKKCGHRPWIEQQAREGFYNILKEETD